MAKLSKAAEAELIKNLRALTEWQDRLQGQIEANHAALVCLFQHAQADAALRARVESGLATWMHDMKTRSDPPSTIAGFESAMKGLVAAFHAGNPSDTTH
jgi:hypothetical protein